MQLMARLGWQARPHLLVIVWTVGHHEVMQVWIGLRLYAGYRSPQMGTANTGGNYSYRIARRGITALGKQGTQVFVCSLVVKADVNRPVKIVKRFRFAIEL